MVSASVAVVVVLVVRLDMYAHAEKTSTAIPVMMSLFLGRRMASVIEHVGGSDHHIPWSAVSPLIISDCAGPDR